jgi:hypothetical protein
MNYAFHRSEIGEVWIQPSLLKEAPKFFLVPPPPTSNLNLLKRDGNEEKEAVVL